MTPQRDYGPLLAQLAAEYERHAPRSAVLNERALKTMIDGGSHNLRLIRPFPPRVVAARGAWVTDEDGNRILDFWQGHFANILGHNPEVVTSALAESFRHGYGLQTGFEDRSEIEAAEIITQQTGAERVRFTTSGALATMYATVLARSFTGRDLVIKVGGGWHGAQPWALKGVYYASTADPWRVESDGLPGSAPAEVIISRFNDPGLLRQQFAQYGNRVACFIVEPFIGSGGFILSDPEYLRTARLLTDEFGALLIFDEVICGFRFRAGDLSALFGVKPDLWTFAKILGGGMPVAAVAGRADVLRLCGRDANSRVRFSGGTYSGHPAAMLASKTLLSHLVEHEHEVYPRLGLMGDKLREITESVFAAEGIHVRCTGYPTSAVRHSSMAMPQFLYNKGQAMASPDDINDPAASDTMLRDKVLQLAMLVEDVHVVHGLGAVSFAHSEADLAFYADKCRLAARRIKPYVAA